LEEGGAAAGTEEDLDFDHIILMGAGLSFFFEPPDLEVV